MKSKPYHSKGLKKRRFHSSRHKHPFFYVVCLLAFFLAACSRAPAPHQARDGRLDLRTWDFEKNATTHLDGQWTIYRQQLLPPALFSGPDPPMPDGTITIPGYWSGRDAVGYATLQLQVRLNPNHAGLALEIGEVISAYRLWINGKPMAAVGKVGASREQEVRKSRKRIIPITPGVPEIDLIFHISNFHLNMGGIADSVHLGLESLIREQAQKEIGASFFLIGCLMVMGIYHVLLYVIRPSERATLHFGLFCLLMGIWYLASGSSDRFLRYLMPSLSDEGIHRVDLVCLYLAVPTVMKYLHVSFPRESVPLVLRCYQWVSIACCVVVLITPGCIFSYTILPYETFAMIAVVYAFILLPRAVLHQREGSLWVLAGFTAFGMTTVNDFLYANRLLQTGYIIPFGVLSMVVSNALVLALRFFRAFATVEILSSDLEEKNIALSRMDRIKDEFLANTSHELRTPLNGIIGLAESIRDGAFGPLPAPLSRNLDLITASGRRLARLINDIQDFSRLKNKDIRLNLEPVDLYALTDTILAVSEPLTGDKALTLRNEIPKSLPCIHGDVLRMQQILFNLVGNAVKFTTQGSVTVTAAQKNGMIRISVTDTGMGIAPEHFESIFQSFEQVQGSESRQFEGTGLGLAITRQLVELHGGTISVSSVPNQGSVFSFTVPVSHEKPRPRQDAVISRPMLRDQPKPPQPLPRMNETVTDPTDQGQRILVVDDDPVNLQVVTNQLTFLENTAVHTQPDGARALAWISEKGAPDLILLDIMMPGMTGYDVCRKLREIHNASALPVILLTARNQVSDLTRGFACGANDYLTKPFSREELLARVKIQLHLKKALDTFMKNRELEKEVTRQKQEKNEARLKEEKTKVAMLRYQLNPHFLFNALSSIRGAIAEDSLAAEEMLSHLAEFTRLALSGDAKFYHSLGREMEMIRHYLKMQQIRLDDYLEISMDMAPETEDMPIPALIVQPLVENAIKYGRLTSPERLEVKITARRVPPDRLELTLSNTGTWIAPRMNSTGIGLKNTRNRLELCYAGDFLLDHSEDNGRVIIKMVLPATLKINHAPSIAAIEE